METLDERLTAVKYGIRERLQDKEMVMSEYWETTYNLLLNEGIVEAPYSAVDTMTISTRIGSGMIDNLGLKECRGIYGRYVCRSDVKLSEAAQNDVEALSEFKSSLRDYLAAVFDSNSFTRSEYDTLVRDYVESSADIYDFRAKSELTGIMLASMESCFDIEEDGPRIGRYNIKLLEESMKRI
ncbi:hypothetical protein HOA59_02370 [archaeon]|jgi:hypothetical protein|nr:hypothetical protein [archaeon]MBT6824259.1 hypothetical protein [archaeon]MBT7107337.1 hypothetical protein [archaeon]MBT7297303.1 hypothetical protein [archaeon]